MNLFCTYFPEGQVEGREKCSAGATFTKRVSADGGEVRDESGDGDSPRFEVECEQHRVYTGGANRFTDEAGTRLQAKTGPYPAVLLPRRALREGNRYAPSVLELTGGETYSGYCFVYTGQP